MDVFYKHCFTLTSLTLLNITNTCEKKKWPYRQKSFVSFTNNIFCKMVSMQVWSTHVEPTCTHKTETDFYKIKHLLVSVGRCLSDNTYFTTVSQVRSWRHLQHYERQQHLLLPRNGAVYLQAIRSLANIVQSMASEDGLQTSPTLNVHPCRCFLEAMTQDGLHVTGVAGGWQSSYLWMGATGATIVLLCGCVWECEQMRVSANKSCWPP